MRGKILILLSIFLAILIAESCSKIYNFRANYYEANALLHLTKKQQNKPFLKAHMKNGDVCILRNTWQVDTVQNLITGVGDRYNYNRIRTSAGPLSLHFDSIAVYETNKMIFGAENQRVTALAILTSVEVIAGIVCLINPKICFGSCPTFYIDPLSNAHYADAEGFSNAILPSMEYADIDAIGQQQILNDTFSITVKNEALETHCIEDVNLLYYPVKSGEKVFQSSDDQFFLCDSSYKLVIAEAPEGDVAKVLSNKDLNERSSSSDENDLNSKEEIILSFDNVPSGQPLALQLTFRQTLMTTYLFYSAMGYMGDQVSEVFSLLETNSILRSRFDTTTKLLGGIEVFTENKEGRWTREGRFNETGPIAQNTQLIRISNSSHKSRFRVKLVLNKGLWRLDQTALLRVKKQVKPFVAKPVKIASKGRTDDLALGRLNKRNGYLITIPGDEYCLSFKTQDSGDRFEMFIRSKGYYLEWMREEWLKEKDMQKLHKMVYAPAEYLRNEASSYKAYEKSMEAEFWNSRIDTKSFSLHED